jgi:hypothetical protein
MAELLKRQFDLLALRIAMDLTRDNPQVHIQLQGHENGEREAIAEWWVQVTEIGLPTKLDRSGRFYSGYSFNFPPDILNEVNEAIASSEYQERPLWLHLAKPIGYLNLVPWEQLLQPALGIPMLRLPDFIANPPRESPHKFEVALCGSAPAAKSEFTVADHLTGIAELLLATVPRRTTVHIFADIEFFDELVARIAQRQLSNVIVHDPASSAGLDAPDRQYALSDPSGRVQNPWLVWMRDALGGRSIDMVQFLTHGYMLRDSGALALAESPLQNQDRDFSRFVDAAELLAFLTQSGAWSAAFSSPEQNYSEMGLRLLADTIAQMRPGPVLHHETRLDPQREALAEAYRFLFGRSHAAPPSSPSLFTYCHPSLITHDELTVKSMNFRSRSVPSAPPATAEDSISAAYAGAEFVPSWIGSSQRYIEQRRHDVERILRDDDATTYSNRSERIEHAQVIEDTLHEIEMELVNVLASKNLGDN